jgi:hypothetical protein
MGMDNPNHHGYLRMVDPRDHKVISLHEEEPYEEEPLYEEGPLELGAKTLNIASSAAFDITLPQKVDEEEEVGDEEEEGVAIDEVNEEEQEEKEDGEARNGKSCSKCLAPQRGGTFKHSAQKLYKKRRREKKRKRDLAELVCGQEELKLEREEVTKMAQTLRESTLKDSPMACMGEIIATM